MSLILWALVAYFGCGLLVYLWAVFFTFAYLRYWDFNIYKYTIGICFYPQWLLGWVYPLVSFMKRRF